MFERYLTDALTTNFGHFVENLDADKVRLSAWNGELVLTDLSLRPNALEHFLPDCPVELTYGRVGNLELRIPWSLFRSQLRRRTSTGRHHQPPAYLSTACSIVLSDVNILITPRRRRETDVQTQEEEDIKKVNNNEDDEDEDDEAAVDQKRIQKEKLVQSLLDGHLLRRVTESSVSSSRSSWSWVQDLLSTLLSTLSVTVRNIHVRYEDPGTCMGFVWEGPGTTFPERTTTISNHSNNKVPRSIRQYRPSFAVGITLHQFSVEAADGQPPMIEARDEEEKEGEGKEELRTATSNVSTGATSTAASARPTTYEFRQKVAAAERLAIYWDSDCNLMAVHSEKLCRQGRGDDAQRTTTMEYSSYYQSAFAIANTQNMTLATSTTAATATTATTTTTTADTSFGHESLYNQRHSYVLDPISPSIDLALVSQKDDTITPTMEQQPNKKIDSVYATDDDDSSNDGSTAAASTSGPAQQHPQAENNSTTPPSGMRIDLPPCKFTLARSTLEDTAYIRKSLSIWRHATNGILSEASLRRLAKLRPNHSPQQDAGGWWVYAVQATLVLSRGNRGEGRRDLEQGATSKLRRRRGWMGFWEAFQRRQRYVALCQSLVPHIAEEPDEKSSMDPAIANQQLLEMEDGLTADEIVAFRLALYETWNSAPLLPYHKKQTTKEETPTSAASSGWKIWKGSSENPKKNALESEQDMLSLNHRISMMYEMTQALERERANVRQSARDEARQAVMHHVSTVDWQETVGDDGTSCSHLEEANPVLWKASVACREIAIQVNDESSDSSSKNRTSRATPVVRFSCAWVQDQCWYQDESWDIDCSLASLLVQDLTVSKDNLSHGYFPNLIARKVITEQSTNDDDFMWIEGIQHHKGLSIAVQRRLHWNRDAENEMIRNTDRGSTTTSRVRILPMEVVYSTVPVEVATRVLGTVKTPELVDDYHRMAAAAHGWQQRQKKKFLAALAHKRKKIVIDIDVGAPELLIPEDINHPESPMLAIDLGRLRVFNDKVSMESSLDYDDQWRLVLSNIQVRSATVATFGQELSPYSTKGSKPIQSYFQPRHLVEPFSLDIAISTKIASEDSQDRTKVRVAATLPRLAFNLNSSSIRLVSRLQRQFENRRNRKNASSPQIPLTLILNTENPPDESVRQVPATDPKKSRKSSANESSQPSSSSRMIQFDFTAPVISLRLANDTDDVQRFNDADDAGPRKNETQLLDLAFRGIRGTLVQESVMTGEASTLFDARLHSLGVIDLYQTAGRDFALLMASATPENLKGLVLDGERYSWVNGEAIRSEIWSGKDLVTIRYSSTSAKGLDGETMPNKLSIGFHELYVEWNPETFASIQKAIRIPDEEMDRPVEFVNTPEKSSEKQSVSEDEFFDAVENESFDSFSDVDSAYLVSEVDSSSFETAEADLHGSVRSWNSSAISLGIQHSWSNTAANALSPTRVAHSSITPLSPHNGAYPIQSPGSLRAQPPVNDTSVSPRGKAFELVFELSKLRVSFNKDARHRKVMIAQMDGTSVSYKTSALDGSKTKMNIGNLVFIDPESIHHSTLYSQILGLKTRSPDQHSEQLSSLLEMEILINPKARSFETGVNISEDKPDKSVVIDRDRGLVIGCNTFVRAKFSPMRFVFLEQLWFEFIDYFFEGMIGSAVWGDTSSKPPASPLLELSQGLASVGDYLPGSDGKGFNFTRFDIELDSPELLFPVTYRSPQFLRLDLGGIHISNKYDGTLIEGNGMDQEINARMQWFNNCSIAMKTLRFFSWCGKELGQNSIVASVALRWPTGPSAPLVTPKWRVTCNFDSLDIALRRTDYALVQNIISYNIGEESRHLNEWRALQKLPPAVFVAYSESIIVHFGYDKKDVTPTTYDLKVSIPSVSVKFIESENESTNPVAVARCIDLVWSLRKDSDLVTKQKATFDVSLVAQSSSNNFEKLLSSWKYDQDTLMEDFETNETEETPELTYTSTSSPSGDNTKTLEIVDACIYADVRAWKRLSGFFSSLPEPALFDETEIATSIQVGDRWYKIGGSAPSQKKAGEESELILPWVKSPPVPQHASAKQILLLPQASHSPTFQMRLSLTSPRIILSSDPSDGAVSRLILRMSHLDCLHINSGVDCRVHRSFLLDEVEVYTLSGILSERRKRDDSNSLIHPWSVGGMMEKCNGNNKGNCLKHVTRISADLLQARAAYSDMAVAIEVCLCVAHSAKSDGRDEVAKVSSANSLPDSTMHSTGPESSPLLSIQHENPPLANCTSPDFSLFDVECDGFELLVKDDSGRHFATNQDLIILSLGQVLFSRRGRRGEPSSIHLRLEGFDLFDCLQSSDSPFRTAATTRSGTIGLDRKVENFIPKDCHSNKSPGLRRFDWDDCKMRSVGDFKFKASPALVQRLDDASRQCSSTQETINSNMSLPSRVIEALCILDGEKMQRYQIRLRCLSVQWNPSTIIAVQRFLGRLRKESKSKIVQVFHDEVDDLIAAKSINLGEEILSSPSHAESSSKTTSIQATIEFQELKLCLNKEHQDRRLLEMTLSSCRLDLDSSQKGMTVDGRVGTLTAWDSDNYPGGIQTDNRHVVKTVPSKQSADGPSDFLSLRYRTFKGSQSSADTGALPAWVQSRISEIGGIDDFLSVKVAATEFTYLKERTEELIDYLSNGLPGKGMGVTSRAAKGFISKRILTKSFLEFQNDSPQVFVPQHEQCTDGVALKLGDVSVRSYFEDENGGASRDWWRVLSLDLSGFQVGVRDDRVFSPATNPIDLKINLRKPTTKGEELSIRGKLSFVDLMLKYSDYILIRYVVSDNIGRQIDTENWDNIEKAYWSEGFGIENAVPTFSIDDDDETHLKPAENRVAYSSNARFVRYGKAGKRKQKMERKDSIGSNSEAASPSRSFEKSGTSVDLKFVLDGLSLKLTRDDRLDESGDEELAAAFCYDVILLRVQLVEISLNATVTGEISFHLSLFRLGLFDLGDKGRSTRERYYASLSRASSSPRKGNGKGPRRPCPFYVIAEGYAPDDEGNRTTHSGQGKQDGPQFVVTVERCPASSARSTGSIADLELPRDSMVNIAGIVVNFLSLNVLIRPLKEALAFVACEWPLPRHHKMNSVQETEDGGHAKHSTSSATVGKIGKSEGLQLKLVANYPRIFFLADESDEHSRALVLRGLAVVNLTKVTRVDDADVKRVVSVDAQLHSMESYINADVHQALCFKTSHVEMVGETNARGFPQPEEELHSESGDSLGVALIQPVTAGIEFCEVRRDRFPTKQSVFVNVEPVSTMLSFEDLNLIETVLARLSSARSSLNSQALHGAELLSMYSEESSTPISRGASLDEGNQTETYEVSFTKQRLGLGLKAIGGMTVVSSVQSAEHEDSIQIGDTLVAIGGVDCVASSLEDVVKRLSTAKRPVSLRFCHQKDKSKQSEITPGKKAPSMDLQLVPTDIEEAKDFMVAAYKIDFKRGIHNGLVLERSCCGGLPIVTRISREDALLASDVFTDGRNADQIETTVDQHAIRNLRPGAVVVAVNDVSIQELGVDETWGRIAYVTELSTGSAASSAPNDVVYSLSFLEIDSELWGKVESIDIASSGFALSFIDDLHGRDMPLFRGQLNALKLHAERGLGGRAQIIEVQPSSILKLEPTGFDKAGTVVSLSNNQVDDLKSESVLTLSGIAMCSVDYFHPRIAFWEPLVEPSQLFLLLETQSGCQASKRPGQVAVELSDRLLREQNFGGKSLSSFMDSSPQMVTFNLTDSSVEVAVKAFSQFKEWRNSKLIPSEEENQDDHQENTEIELRESTPLQHEHAQLESPLSGRVLDEERFGGSPRLEAQTETRRDVKRAAAQKAAQAALVFAQKRGADSSKKGDSAKPFVLRNRTGVSIAFVPQDAGLNRAESSQRKVNTHNLSVVGEYTGLAEYDPLSIHELADKEDAKFSLEIMSDDDGSRAKRDQTTATQTASNKVRNYEGRFPGLTVAIQAVSGVLIEPLLDLQVYKVGSTVRHLIVRKDISRHGHEECDSTEYSIPVVWKVEIEDNRRVLTLSTAVRVATTAFATEMEIGVQRMAYDEPSEKTLNSSFPITSIGVVRPESPFYLPLWLALKLEAVSIFVRPRLDGSALYDWGRSSILRFAPFLSRADVSGHDEDLGTWVWEETFEELDYIHCDSIDESSLPVWLAVFSGSSSNNAEQFAGSKLRKITSTMTFEEEHHEVISVTLDSNVTIRNMLPMSVDWQLAHVAYGSAPPTVVDGSHTRSMTKRRGNDDLSLSQSNSLHSGECTEVFACDYGSSELQARFKEPDGQNWSGWAPLGLQENVDFEKQDEEEEDTNVKALFPRACQVNVQVTNDSFGVPLTFGVRIVPKMTLGTLDEPVKTQIYGIEIIVYAELWIRNITSLPLNFGCPSYQVHGSAASPAGTFDDTATRFNAESALMEIASLLEGGDKGMGLSKKAAREVATTGGIESLPNQECDELWEEVFEYLEIEYSTVKRRWWASESYDSFRMNITLSNENGRWHWVGENWSIDTAGEVNASLGGWESSRNLLGGAGSFSGKRTFDSSHPIRRRRYFRNRSGHRVPRKQFEPQQTEERIRNPPPGCLHGGLQAFHHPLNDSFSREHSRVLRKKKRKKNIAVNNGEKDPGASAEASIQIAVKCADGKWSLPATIPDSGTSHGALRVLASRWPALTAARNNSASNLNSPSGVERRGMNDVTSPFFYQRASLSPMLYELCYTVSDVEGEWGEFSRSMVVSPRFMVRNDSTRFSIEVKQAGTSDSSSLKLIPGASEPFYWEDFRLPGLLCVSLCVTNDEGRSVYKWSGGFDICNLGMVPLRIRREVAEEGTMQNVPLIRSVRALVEIRPGTGGFGINISFREEDPFGDGSLFRIENLSPFPVWLSQDGVLVNPSKLWGRSSFSVDDDFEANGDLVRPSEKCAFALDVPYRQGKYAHRKQATLKELLRVRLALAPLAHRAGVETVKVIAMTNVGETIRLNPSKLFGVLDDELRTRMQGMRVIAVLCSDGPTRVLKLMLATVLDEDVIGNTFREVSYMASKQNTSPVISSQTSRQETQLREIQESATSAFSLYAEGELPDEEKVRRDAFFSALEKEGAETQLDLLGDSDEAGMDQIYSIRAQFSGFLFSLVDSTPSEIAVATLRNFNALARWNGLRTNEASLILSVGWLQVDNHVPSSPFKVAVKPDISRRSEMDDPDGESGSTDQVDTRPLLMVAIAFAPKHKSGIVCLRSVTIAPRNLVIAVDLAFLVRLQRFFMDLKSHFRTSSTEDGNASSNPGALLMYGEQKRNILFPNFKTAEEELKRAAAFGTENQNLYFQGLTILPAAITLSVAPARALTPAQAALEGKELAAIHQAVRKGDVLVGSSSALLGVRVGRTNTTPLAVVRGVFKSIVVDTLLRLDGASLNFSGVFLRNHISTGPQLTTYLLAHYLASLRQNVPALLGSLAAFGNPLGLIRGLGDGMSDFVSQPVQGLKKSVQELDPTYLVDGVARGTGSLARHAVGGFADSASLLTETFSKNMAVLTLDRRYAQKRDRSKQLRLNGATTVTLAGGVESGFVKLVQGFMEGVTGVVKAPMRGAEKRGIEGFAKGIGKGLLGLLVKPIIGISDAATDVMIGVKNSVENATGDLQQNLTLDRNQFRPRRPMYGRDKVLRPYKLEDAAAAALMLRTRCAGENYLGHFDMGDRVALLSVKRLILLGPKGQELMALKYKHVSKAEVRRIPNDDNSIGWAIIIVLNTPRKNGSEVEVLTCKSRQEAEELCAHLQRGIDVIASDKAM